MNTEEEQVHSAAVGTCDECPKEQPGDDDAVGTLEVTEPIFEKHRHDGESGESIDALSKKPVQGDHLQPLEESLVQTDLECIQQTSTEKKRTKGKSQSQHSLKSKSKPSQLTPAQKAYWQKKLPAGFDYYLSFIARSVITSQPPDIARFCAELLEGLELTRSQELSRLPEKSYLEQLREKKFGTRNSDGGEDLPHPGTNWDNAEDEKDAGAEGWSLTDKKEAPTALGRATSTASGGTSPTALGGMLPTVPGGTPPTALGGASPTYNRTGRTCTHHSEETADQTRRAAQSPSEKEEANGAEGACSKSPKTAQKSAESLGRISTKTYENFVSKVWKVSAESLEERTAFFESFSGTDVVINNSNNPDSDGDFHTPDEENSGADIELGSPPNEVEIFESARPNNNSVENESRSSDVVEDVSDHADLPNCDLGEGFYKVEQTEDIAVPSHEEEEKENVGVCGAIQGDTEFVINLGHVEGKHLHLTLSHTSKEHHTPQGEVVSVNVTVTITEVASQLSEYVGYHLEDEEGEERSSRIAKDSLAPFLTSDAVCPITLQENPCTHLESEASCPTFAPGAVSPDNIENNGSLGMTPSNTLSDVIEGGEHVEHVVEAVILKPEGKSVSSSPSKQKHNDDSTSAKLSPVEHLAMDALHTEINTELISEESPIKGEDKEPLDFKADKTSHEQSEAVDLPESDIVETCCKIAVENATQPSLEIEPPLETNTLAFEDIGFSTWDKNEMKDTLITSSDKEPCSIPENTMCLAPENISSTGREDSPHPSVENTPNPVLESAPCSIPEDAPHTAEENAPFTVTEDAQYTAPENEPDTTPENAHCKTSKSGSLLFSDNAPNTTQEKAPCAPLECGRCTALPCKDSDIATLHDSENALSKDSKIVSCVVPDCTPYTAAEREPCISTECAPCSTTESAPLAAPQLSPHTASKNVLHRASENLLHPIQEKVSCNTESIPLSSSEKSPRAAFGSDSLILKQNKAIIFRSGLKYVTSAAEKNAKAPGTVGQTCHTTDKELNKTVSIDSGGSMVAASEPEIVISSADASSLNREEDGVPTMEAKEISPIKDSMQSIDHDEDVKPTALSQEAPPYQPPTDKESESITNDLVPDEAKCQQPSPTHSGTIKKEVQASNTFTKSPKSGRKNKTKDPDVAHRKTKSPTSPPKGVNVKERIKQFNFTGMLHPAISQLSPPKAKDRTETNTLAEMPTTDNLLCSPKKTTHEAWLKSSFIESNTSREEDKLSRRTKLRLRSIEKTEKKKRDGRTTLHSNTTGKQNGKTKSGKKTGRSKGVSVSVGSGEETPEFDETQVSEDITGIYGPQTRIVRAALLLWWSKALRGGKGKRSEFGAYRRGLLSHLESPTCSSGPSSPSDDSMSQEKPIEESCKSKAKMLEGMLNLETRVAPSHSDKNSDIGVVDSQINTGEKRKDSENSGTKEENKESGWHNRTIKHAQKETRDENVSKLLSDMCKSKLAAMQGSVVYAERVKTSENTSLCVTLSEDDFENRKLHDTKIQKQTMSFSEKRAAIARSLGVSGDLRADMSNSPGQIKRITTTHISQVRGVKALEGTESVDRFSESTLNVIHSKINEDIIGICKDDCENTSRLDDLHRNYIASEEYASSKNDLGTHDADSNCMEDISVTNTDVDEPGSYIAEQKASPSEEARKAEMGEFLKTSRLLAEEAERAVCNVESIISSRLCHVSDTNSMTDDSHQSVAELTEKDAEFSEGKALAPALGPTFCCGNSKKRHRKKRNSHKPETEPATIADKKGNLSEKCDIGSKDVSSTLHLEDKTLTYPGLFSIKRSRLNEISARILEVIESGTENTVPGFKNDNLELCFEIQTGQMVFTIQPIFQSEKVLSKHQTVRDGRGNMQTDGQDQPEKFDGGAHVKDEEGLRIGRNSEVRNNLTNNASCNNFTNFTCNTEIVAGLVLSTNDKNLKTSKKFTNLDLFFTDETVGLAITNECNALVFMNTMVNDDSFIKDGFHNRLVTSDTCFITEWVLNQNNNSDNENVRPATEEAERNRSGAEAAKCLDLSCPENAVSVKGVLPPTACHNVSNVYDHNSKRNQNQEPPPPRTSWLATSFGMMGVSRYSRTYYQRDPSPEVDESSTSNFVSRNSIFSSGTEQRCITYGNERPATPEPAGNFGPVVKGRFHGKPTWLPPSHYSTVNESTSQCAIGNLPFIARKRSATPCRLKFKSDKISTPPLKGCIQAKKGVKAYKKDNNPTQETAPAPSMDANLDKPVTSYSDYLHMLPFFHSGVDKPPQTGVETPKVEGTASDKCDPEKITVPDATGSTKGVKRILLRKSPQSTDTIKNKPCYVNKNKNRNSSSKPGEGIHFHRKLKFMGSKSIHQIERQDSDLSVTLCSYGFDGTVATTREKVLAELSKILNCSQARQFENIAYWESLTADENQIPFQILSCDVFENSPESQSNHTPSEKWQRKLNSSMVELHRDSYGCWKASKQEANRNQESSNKKTLGQYGNGNQHEVPNYLTSNYSSSQYQDKVTREHNQQVFQPDYGKNKDQECNGMHKTEDPNNIGKSTANEIGNRDGHGTIFGVTYKMFQSGIKKITTATMGESLRPSGTVDAKIPEIVKSGRYSDDKKTSGGSSGTETGPPVVSPVSSPVGERDRFTSHESDSYSKHLYYNSATEEIGEILRARSPKSRSRSKVKISKGDKEREDVQCETNKEPKHDGAGSIKCVKQKVSIVLTPTSMESDSNLKLEVRRKAIKETDSKLTKDAREPTKPKSVVDGTDPLSIARKPCVIVIPSNPSPKKIKKRESKKDDFIENTQEEAQLKEHRQKLGQSSDFMENTREEAQLKEHTQKLGPLSDFIEDNEDESCVSSIQKKLSPSYRMMAENLPEEREDSRVIVYPSPERKQRSKTPSSERGQSLVASWHVKRTRRWPLIQSPRQSVQRPAGNSGTSLSPVVSRDGKTLSLGVRDKSRLTNLTESDFPMRLCEVQRPEDENEAADVKRVLTLEQPKESVFISTTYDKRPFTQRTTKGIRKVGNTNKRLYLIGDPFDGFRLQQNDSRMRCLICEPEAFAGKNGNSSQLVIENGSSDSAPPAKPRYDTPWGVARPRLAKIIGEHEQMSDSHKTPMKISDYSNPTRKTHEEAKGLKQHSQEVRKQEVRKNPTKSSVQDALFSKTIVELGDIPDKETSPPANLGDSGFKVQDTRIGIPDVYKIGHSVVIGKPAGQPWLSIKGHSKHEKEKKENSYSQRIRRFHSLSPERKHYFE